MWKFVISYGIIPNLKLKKYLLCRREYKLAIMKIHVTLLVVCIFTKVKFYNVNKSTGNLNTCIWSNATITCSLTYIHTEINDSSTWLTWWCWRVEFVRIFSTFHDKQKHIPSQICENIFNFSWQTQTHSLTNCDTWHTRST